MIGQYLSQELGIAYYKTMSKFAQYRRNVSKNHISSIQANLLPNKIIQEVIQ
jgi:hypothetical protein